MGWCTGFGTRCSCPDSGWWWCSLLLGIGLLVGLSFALSSYVNTAELIQATCSFPLIDFKEPVSGSNRSHIQVDSVVVVTSDNSTLSLNATTSFEGPVAACDAWSQTYSQKTNVNCYYHRRNNEVRVPADSGEEKEVDLIVTLVCLVTLGILAIMGCCFCCRW